MHRAPSCQLHVNQGKGGHTVSSDLYFLMNLVESAKFIPVISLNSDIICVSRCLFAFVDYSSARLETG